MPTIRVEMVRERSVEQKRTLAHGYRRLVRPGRAPQGVTVVFHDVAKHDWASAGCCSATPAAGAAGFMNAGGGRRRGRSDARRRGMSPPVTGAGSTVVPHAVDAAVGKHRLLHSGARSAGGSPACRCAGRPLRILDAVQDDA